MTRRRRRRLPDDDLPFHAPVERLDDGGYALHLERAERDVVSRLLVELRHLLTGPADHPLVQRLFPPAHIDDPEQEAEYQRLMRDDLLASRLASLDAVQTAFDDDAVLDEGGITAFMQSVNGLRLALGTMLDVAEDDEVADDDSSEHHLYVYLSWLLEWTVRARSEA